MAEKNPNPSEPKKAPEFDASAARMALEQDAAKRREEAIRRTTDVMEELRCVYRVNVYVGDDGRIQREIDIKAT